MSKHTRHYLVEHIWRALRAILLITAMIVWISEDGITGTEWAVVGLAILAHLVEQFHGVICNGLERLFGWKQDFNNLD